MESGIGEMLGDLELDLLALDGVTKPKITMDELVNHLFLPKYQPQNEEDNREHIELTILKRMSRVSQPILNRQSLTKIGRTLETWIALQERTKDVKSVLEHLQNGENACLFVRQQNCTIQFTKFDNETMRVITFRSSLPNESIIGTCGSIKVTFPETVDIVPISPLLLSQCFSDQLTNLTCNNSAIAMPTAIKARQEHEEAREPSFPFVVSEFLVQMLCPKDPQQLGTRVSMEAIKIQKKLRDQINWKSCTLPFRRSGLWMAIKVILQMSLQEEMKNKQEAYVMYKITILEFLLCVAEEYNQIPGARWDVIAQILVKLARRAKKLSRMGKCANAELESQREDTIKKVITIIENIHQPVTQQWNSTSLIPESFAVPNNFLEIMHICRSKTNWLDDCIHKMKTLTTYVNSERIPDFPNDTIDNLNKIDPVIQTEAVNMDALLDRHGKGFSSTRQDPHLNDKSIWIYQVEWFARHGLHKNHNCKQIFDLLLAYSKTVHGLYGNTYCDPVYFSRMAIIFLKFVAVLDEIAVERHPLLQSYKTGIKPEMFERLLIPGKQDMKMVENLQNYFGQRNMTAMYDKWLGHECEVEYQHMNDYDTSFPVKFAKGNFEMIQLKAKILRDSEIEIELKSNEIQRVRTECSDLQRRINASSHKYKWDKYWAKDVHDSENCICCYLKSELDMKRVSVARYQRPLPPEEQLKDAVVFELCIPPEIAYLRDSQSILRSELFGYPTLDSATSKNIHTRWMSFSKLDHYIHKGHQKFIHLGSQAKDTLTTHYGKQNPDVVLSNETSFILENGLNCKVWKESCLGEKKPSHPFTFQISKTIHKEASDFKSLQFALNMERPTENEVIAHQYSCHQNVNLKEFITFGSIRCGPNIQLRNLYAAIASQILALDKEPVLTLIMQTVFELGPGRREIYLDFELTGMAPFCHEFLDLLQKLCKGNATNWSNPMVLLSLTVITVKILEMTESPEVKESAARILQEYRAVVDEWCNKLESLIVKSSDKTEEKELMNLLLKSAICSAFTFNVSTENLPYVLKDPTDVTLWLKTLSRLHTLVVRESIMTEGNPLSSFMKNLLRHARHVIPMNLQNHLYTKLVETTWNRALHCFVCTKWPGTRQVSCATIPKFHHSVSQDSLKKHAFQAVYVIPDDINHHIVCVDILCGTFFVDGFEPSLLPESIIRHPLYQSFFHKSKFRVQRTSRTFKTVDKYCGNHFEFTEVGDRLVIRQISSVGDGSYFELLPMELLKKQVAHDLIYNFTHWFDSETKVVYFRRPSSSSSSNNEENIEIDTDADYLLKPVLSNDVLAPVRQKWHLTKLNGNSNSNIYFLSIKSDGFKKITKNLGKLENDKFIHVTLAEVEDELNIIAKLWRFNLSFSLNQDEGVLYCENYPGHYIPTSKSRGQCLGTLVGLQNGIVLEKQTVSESSGNKKLFLIQHGTVQIQVNNSESGQKHQTVCITEKDEDGQKQKKTMRNPIYFAFEVDQILNRLRPGNSKAAWLYLALLHGATSSPFPDPFTQLSGTEMAMCILQSGSVWSCSPYDPECLATLGQIAALSPKYSYYPKHMKVMQTTEWPSGLDGNAYAAYDGYAIIVQKLLKDSSRLAGLFGQGTNKKDENMISPQKDYLKLWKRSYYRNINMYNHIAHLTTEFIDDPIDSFGAHKRPSHQKSLISRDLNELAQLRHLRVPYRSANQTISSFIMTSDPLHCRNTEDDFAEGCLNTWFGTNLRDNWLQLYALSRDSAEKTTFEHDLTLLFGAILYSGNGTFAQLLNLHNVSLIHNSSASGQNFPQPIESLTNEPYQPTNHNFETETISNILSGAADSSPSQYSFETHKEYQKALDEYDRSLKLQTCNVSNSLKALWPVQSISMADLHYFVSGNHLLNSTADCHHSTSRLLTQWFNNLTLKRLVNEVDGILQDIQKNNVQSENICTAYKATDWNLHFETVKDLKDVWIPEQNLFEDIPPNESLAVVIEAKQIFSAGQLDILNTLPHFEQRRNHCIELAERFTQNLSDIVLDHNHIRKGLRNAGIHVRLAPVILLRDYVANCKKLRDNPLIHVMGALAVIWVNMRRLNRLIMYDDNKEKYSVELAREQETVGCMNWSSMKNPDWLVLELELDITIRPIQVDVARHMMNMSKGKNGVMQLNMGEGKTSVIVPMVVSTLASKREMMCRVTVLYSIFATNQSLLSFAIGGFLNRRVYTVPCSRDTNIEKYLDKIDKVYQECTRLGGVVITLPEYRLSFRLQIYNQFLDNKHDIGFKMYGIESWLRKHARDIVDESDEIYSVKYQLIYTTGKQQHIDGGNMRWTVCQKVFEFLPQVASRLCEKYGPVAIEFNRKEASDNPQWFTRFRILSDKCKILFYELVADGILNGEVDLLGHVLTEEQRKVVKKFLTEEDISEEDHSKFLQLEGISEPKKDILLLVSGYLRRGILFTALKKRWRVDYGVKVPKSGASSKLMAVPFRAKDVAAERAEFGHPDMGIVLTQISYYYSGLNDEQLYQCFHILETGITGPEGVYNAWIKKIPTGKITTDTIKTYKGVNLQDYDQRTQHLFPLLRKHKAVVDFWLENVAFPKECKVFPGKFVTNAWDLCYERYTHPTTGFSGTNDTSLLLPSQITQQDLPVLKETNAKLEETLKREENQYRRTLEMGATCKAVLKYMIEDGLRVLIDAGALMLELGNARVAQLWLEMDKSLEGVMYFNENGEMVIKTIGQGYRKNRNRCLKEEDQLLRLSSLRDRLDRCAIFLDDQHTRGTDIKLPTDFKACVTIGSGMRRDKLLQACMRMRKLGKGQSVHFYLSHEVDNKIIQKKCQGDTSCCNPITVSDILEWVKENSRQFEKDGLMYWATNAKTYAKNLAADDLFDLLSDKSKEEMEVLGQLCKDDDAQELQVMYGTFHHPVKLIDLIPKWFSKIQSKLTNAKGIDLPESVLATLKLIEDSLLTKCREHIPNQICFYNMLGEEQEKELEPEQEEEMEKNRPRQEKPSQPHKSENVVHCVTTTGKPFVASGISSLHDMFKKTTLWGKMKFGWGNQWFVTEDFIKVIKRESNEKGNEVDCFLRPMRYFVSFTKNGQAPSILLLSQFEVNEFVSNFRTATCAKGATLHMFSGRWMGGQSTFAHSPRLQLPLDLEGFGIYLDEQAMAPMLIAAGNLYFDSMEQQKAFARFLGLSLRPWTEDQEKAFDKKEISSTGFLSRDCVSLSRDGCNFEDDPTEMMRGILKIRNDVLRDTDHTVQILERVHFV